MGLTRAARGRAVRRSTSARRVPGAPARRAARPARAGRPRRRRAPARRSAGTTARVPLAALLLLGPELRERLLRGGLLGILLRLALTHTGLLAVDHRRRREVPLVRRPLDVDHGVGDLPPAARQRLLELRLVVDVGRPRVLDPAREGRDDRVLDRLE